ncbi:ABC transporter permease [Paraburkholderia strydomiana]|uniref:ABC transporter permease n=1 Tax=Paraburkholderia strydomiana TaxID=1245417 RepID=UPI0038B7FBBB
MEGILRLAFKLLINDNVKFTALLVGITFAVFLMVEMTSLFAGILKKSSSTVINIGAKVWVMDPAVHTIASSIGMPAYVLDAVRSTDGAKYAVPLYSGSALVKLRDGTYQAVSVICLDDASLFGWPIMKQGKSEDIYAENGFIAIDDAEFVKLKNPTLGTDFELNDHRGVVVGIATVASSGLFGTPTLYTTYKRAVTYIPATRYATSYILVEPKSAADIAHIKKVVQSLGGLGTNIMLMTIISFVVGLSISGQTYCTFILENLEKFGALKAMGAKRHELVAMLLFQATFTALTGYGLGIGLCAGLISLAWLCIPDYAAIITYRNLALAFDMVVVIAAMSSYLGIRRVPRIKPFDIFRG